MGDGCWGENREAGRGPGTGYYLEKRVLPAFKVEQFEQVSTQNQWGVHPIVGASSRVGSFSRYKKHPVQLFTLKVSALR